MNEINVFGVVGEDITAADIKASIASFDTSQPLVVNIDSQGGVVLQGNAIWNAIKSYQGTTKAVVQSFAGSIASYLLTAFDEVEITPNGFVMLHNPTMQFVGDSEEYASKAKLLSDMQSEMETAYADQMGMDREEVAALMKTETWFTAEEALDVGLVSKVLSQPSPTQVPVAFIEKLPHGVAKSLRKDTPAGDKQETSEMSQKAEPVAATVKELRTAFPKMSDTFVLGCIEKSLPMASCAEAAASELLKENEELKARVQAMEDEKAAAQEESDANAKAEEEEAEKEEADEQEAAQAAAKGHSAVGNVGGGSGPTAAARWTEAVASFGNAIPRHLAVRKANRANPGLRDQMVAEANAGRE